MMKQNSIASPTRPGFTGKALNHRVNLCRLAVRSVAVCAIVTHCLNPARAADALPANDPGTRATPVEKPAYVPQGRQMERYKAFARQAELPVITVTDNTTLEVGGTLKADLNRLARLSVRDKEALAGQFGVPAGVIGKVANTLRAPPRGALRSSLKTFARQSSTTGSCKVSGNDTIRRLKARRSRPMRSRPSKPATLARHGRCMTGCRGPHRLAIFASLLNLKLRPHELSFKREPA